MENAAKSQYMHTWTPLSRGGMPWRTVICRHVACSGAASEHRVSWMACNIFPSLFKEALHLCSTACDRSEVEMRLKKRVHAVPM